MVFSETVGTTARTRVFATDGSLLWTDPNPTMTADIAWSADGSRLVIGSQPATFKILTFGTAVAPKVVTRTYPGQAYRAMGFSASGAILYSWDTNGEAEYWESPLEIALPDGKPTTIAKFSGDPDPIVPANGTSPTSDLGIVNGWSSGSGVQPGVDPATGRVLDRGGAAGVGTWELRDGTTVSPVLFGNGDVPELAWGPGSSLVVAWVASTNGPIRIYSSALDGPPPVGPDFQVAAGAYWRSFFGARGSTALLGLGAERAKDFDYLGADELVAVDLKTGASAVFVPTKPGSTGLHPAGWITGP